MAEPATTTAASLVLAGAGSVVLSTLGLDPAQLFWALIGSTIGCTLAAASSRMRAVVVFVCVVLICSISGAGVSQALAWGPLGSKIAACLLALVFHPLVDAAVTQIPKLIDAARAKFLGGQP